MNLPRQPRMRSMTGFGEAAVESEIGRIAVSIRSVNHKNLDIVLRLPEDFREYEGEVREEIASQLRRGRVDVRFDCDDLRRLETTVGLNPAIVQALQKIRQEMTANELPINPVGFGDLVRIPDALHYRTTPRAITFDVSAVLVGAVGQAVSQVVESRETEGQALGIKLGELLDKLRSIVSEIVSSEPEVSDALSSTFRQRLSRLNGAESQVDPGRVAQEVAILLEKTDIREELDRLATHLGHFRTVMTDQGAVGRKLDFLAQEIFRELNTLAAKCRHTEIVQAVINAKLLCEQIREQVQNIE